MAIPRMCGSTDVQSMPEASGRRPSHCGTVEVPSGKPTVCYLKMAMEIVDVPSDSMVDLSIVTLPEGN